jgi:hypothetical protein
MSVVRDCVGGQHNTTPALSAATTNSRTFRVVVVKDQIDRPRLEDLDAVVGPVVEYHLAEDGEVVGLRRLELIQIMGMAGTTMLLSCSDHHAD